MNVKLPPDSAESHPISFSRPTNMAATGEMAERNSFGENLRIGLPNKKNICLLTFLSCCCHIQSMYMRLQYCDFKRQGQAFNEWWMVFCKNWKNNIISWIEESINCVPLSRRYSRHCVDIYWGKSWRQLWRLPWTRCTSNSQTSSHSLDRQMGTRWCLSNMSIWKCPAGCMCTIPSRWQQHWWGTFRQTLRWRWKRIEHSV